MIPILSKIMSEACKYGTNHDIVEDYANGIIMCTKCKKIISDYLIDEQYEKRTFESDNHEIQRVGPASSSEQESEAGNFLIIKENGHTQKRVIHPQQSRIHKNSIRIHKLLSKADVFPNIIEKIKEEYRELDKIKNFQGTNLDHIIIALYYYVSRKEKKAISIKDVAKKFPSYTERQISKAFNWFKGDVVEYDDEDELITEEKNFIQYYIGRDVAKCKAKMLSYKIIEKINNNALLEGKSPTTVAGLSLMLSYKLLNDKSDSMKDFFSTFATKATLRRTFKEISNQLDQVIPNEYFDKIEEIKKSME